jgi:tripartite-type tricarboxylate transporter receptor subunit TctC
MEISFHEHATRPGAARNDVRQANACKGLSQDHAGVIFCTIGGMHHRRVNLVVLSLSITLTVLGAAPVAQAQGKPIRLIVPYAAGGPIDITARVLAEQVKDTLGPVIVDNRAGAGGNIGADAVAKAAPDGLTIGIAATATHAVNPWLYSKMPYKAATDFAPITQILRVPNVLVMNSEVAQRLSIRSVADLIAYAKANPGRLNYGSGGNGSAGHLAGEMFKAQAGIFAVHIPYNGGSPAQLALLSGQVDFNFDNLATAAPNIRSGKLKALAVTTLRRSPALPDVPPVADTLKGFSIDTWWGLVAPAATPRDVIARLNQAFVAALKTPQTQARFASLMAEPVPTTPEEFGTFMQSELAKYERVVKASGASVD